MSTSINPLIKWSGGKGDEIKNFEKYFPKDYDFDLFMKNKFWMCYPEIPNPNYDDFINEINKIRFSEESIKLNKNFKPFEIKLV